MKKQNSFEQKLTTLLSVNEKKNTQIRDAVVQHCFNANFILASDKQMNTARFKWLNEVIQNNIHGLSLLQQIIVDTADISDLADLKDDIDEKAALIVKDIAKRVMLSTCEYPSDNSSQGYQTKSINTMK